VGTVQHSTQFLSLFFNYLKNLVVYGKMLLANECHVFIAVVRNNFRFCKCKINKMGYVPDSPVIGFRF